MKNVRTMLIALSVAASVGAGSIATIGSASAATPCVVGKANHFTVNADNTITASFTVKGDAGCTQPVSLLSWNADSTLYPKPEFFTSQTMFDRTTQTFGVGTHTMTVKLPTCSTDARFVRSYQADIIAGANPAANITAPGTPGYYWEAQADGTFRVVDAKIAPGTCPAAAPVTPAAPAAVTTATPAAPVAQQPTALVNTGPGSAVALAITTVIAGAIAHSVIVRRKLARS